MPTSREGRGAQLGKPALIVGLDEGVGATWVEASLAELEERRLAPTGCLVALREVLHPGQDPSLRLGVRHRRPESGERQVRVGSRLHAEEEARVRLRPPRRSARRRGLPRICGSRVPRLRLARC